MVSYSTNNCLSTPWMDDVFGGLIGPARRGSSWTPAVEVRENESGYVVTAEVSGLAPDAIDVTFENGLLTLKGEKTRPEAGEGEQVRHAERRYGAFARRFKFPVAVDAENVSATFEDGLLVVQLSKVAAAQPRRIEVKTT